MILPGASYRPLSFAPTLPPRVPKRAAMRLHTNGGGSDLHSWFEQEYAATRERIGSHFQVFRDGRVEQYVDTDLIVWAAYSCSEWAVEVETEDDGNPAVPWTVAQIASIVTIGKALGVPGAILAELPSDGVGWHEQYASCNRTGHLCPGAVRESQIRAFVIPMLGGAAPVPVPTPAPPVAPRWPGRFLRNVAPMMHGSDVALWQSRMAQRGWKITADGWYGSASETVCRAFQAEKRLTVDGIVGPNTWAAAWVAPVT